MLTHYSTELVRVETIATVIRNGRMRRCGHVVRENDVWRSEFKTEDQLEDQERHV